MSMFTQRRLKLLLVVAAALVLAVPEVLYAQFGGLMGAVKGKALETLTNTVMSQLEKKFAESVDKQPISDAAKAEIVKKLTEMARPIVKKFIDAAGSGSLPNPSDLVQTVLKDILPKVPELVAAAKTQGGGVAAAPAAQQAAPTQQAAGQYPPQGQYPLPAQQVAAPVQPAVAVAPPPAAPVIVAPPERPKIACYVFGGDDPAINKAMATRLIIALDNCGRYQAVENYKEFFEQALEAQKGGAITSKQFKKLGAQFSAEYVCVAEINIVFGDKSVSAHTLKVDAIGIAEIGAADIPLKSLNDLTAASEQIIESMFKNSSRPGNFGTLKDTRDGKTYKTISIGGKTWTAENMGYKAASGSWCYSSDCDKYASRLYDWNTANSVCPAGWHLPSRQEWDSMVTAAGGPSTAGKKLKSTSGWSNGNGTDDYGFAATPDGYRANNGGFGNAGNGGNWWTATENGSAYGYALRISSYDDSVDATYNYKDYGFSVRCAQD